MSEGENEIKTAVAPSGKTDDGTRRHMRHRFFNIDDSQTVQQPSSKLFIQGEIAISSKLTMKWQILCSALSISAALASPVNPAVSRDTREVYTLRISTYFAEEIDGKHLSVNGTQVGVFQNAPEVQFYSLPSDKSGKVELHIYPVVGSDDRVLALIGTNGLLDFSVTNPTKTSSVPVGTICDWESFAMEATPQTSGKPNNLLAYAASSPGSWVAFKTSNDDWSVNWRDDSAITIEKRSYMIIDVVYEQVASQ